MTDLDSSGLWLGRIECKAGPCIVTLRGGALVDITSREAPTVRDILECGDTPSRSEVSVALNRRKDLR